MTKEEELEKEAEQSYLDNTDKMQWDAEGEFDYTRGYLNAAEPREKRIAELEQQIEKMKRCLNKWYEYENERDTPHINIDELLTETQQFTS